MRWEKLIKYVLFLVIIILFGSCENKDEDIVGPKGKVSVASDKELGKYLTDEEGKTLYVYAADLKGNSACNSEDCLNNWKIFNRGKLNLGSNLDQSNFGKITRGDDRPQTTYKGWPLYYFKDDNNPGAIKGNGKNKMWFVAKPNYTIMLGKINGKKYLVDEKGMVLYQFTRDKYQVSICEDVCAENWPPFHEKTSKGNIILPSILDTSNYERILRDDGKKQIAYKGWPLYYFTDDTKRGQIKSEGAYNSWFTVNPFEELLTPPDPEKNLKVGVSSELGSVIMDGENRTLYLNIKDVHGKSTCKDGCLDKWPLFFTANFRVTPLLNASKFGVIDRRFSSGQSTYKGWPLYYHSPDADGTPESAGSTEGNGENKEFFTANPDYTIFLGKQSKKAGKEPEIYLTDEKGRTLYFSKIDSFKTSNCSGGCLENWEPFFRENRIVPSFLNKENFSFFTRKDGKRQLTYKGWPLYYYVKDNDKIESRGSLKGQGKNNNWSIVNPKKINKPSE